MKSVKQINNKQEHAGGDAQCGTARPLWQRILAGALIVTLELAPIKLSFDSVMGLRFGWNAAYAGGPLADPYAAVQFQPKVTHSSAGVPVVNITAPNAAGISLNRYQQFDIEAAGLILNNSMVGGGTLLGGEVTGNPNLNGRAANLIINEVTPGGSAFASQLNGGIEVFGAPAHVIVANPNGIHCTGCAFVNAPRLTLTSGAVELLSAPNGKPTAFDSATAFALAVTSGHIDVGGIGIEGTTGRIDIIAETMAIDAALRANLRGGSNSEINLIAGRNRVAEDANGAYVVTPSGATNTAAAVRSTNPHVQSYAIDASALGAMSAGQIKLIATTEGLGVKADGALAATAAGLSIDSNGQIRVGNVSAKQDVALNAKDDVAVGGKLVGAAATLSGANIAVDGAVETSGHLSVDAARDASFSGLVAAARDVNVRAGGGLLQLDQFTIGGRYDARAGNITAFGATRADAGIELQSSGAITFADLATQQRIDLSAQGDITGTGHAAALAGMSIASSNGGVYTEGSLASGAGLSVRAEQDALVGGNVTVAGDADLASGRTLSVAGSFGVGGSATLAAHGSLALAARTDVAGHASLHSQAGDLLALGDITAGTIAAQASGDLILDGTLSAVSDVNLAAGGSVVTTGNIVAGAGLRQQAGADIFNGGTTLAFGDLSATAGRDVSLAGALVAGGDLSIVAQRDLSTNAIAQIAGDARLHAVSGSIAAGGNLNVGGSANLSAGDAITTRGDIAAGSNATLNAQQSIDAARVSALQDVALNSSSGSVSTSGALLAAGRISVGARTDISAGAQMNALGDVGLHAASGSLTVSGAVITAASLNASAGNDVVMHDSVSATGGVSLNAGRNLSTRAVDAGDSMTLNAGAALSAAARLSAVSGISAGAQDVALSGAISNADVNVSATRAISLSGDIIGQGDVNLAAGGVLNNDANVSAGRNLSVSGGALVNNANLSSAAATNLAFGSLTNRGSVYGTTNTINGAHIDNSGGNLLAADLLRVNAASLIGNANGTLTSARDLNLSLSGTLDNANGRIVAGNDLSLKVAGTFDPSAAVSGYIAAGNLLSIDALTLANSGTWLPNSKGLSLTTSGDFANSGVIEMAGDFRIATSGNISNSGEIKTGGSIALAGSNVSNSNLLKADANIELSGSVSNRGTIAAGQDVLVSGSTFDNSKGSAHASRDMRLDVNGTVTNAAGTLTASNNITLSAASLDNDREAPTTLVEHTATYDAEQLAPIVVSKEEIITTCDSHVVDRCMDQILPEITIGSLNPDYQAGTVTRSYYTATHKKSPLVEQIALPLYETTRTTQTHGAESRITAGGDLSIALAGELGNRGSTIEAGGNVAITANSLQNGRSETITQRLAASVNQTQLEQFIEDLDRIQTEFGVQRTYELPTLTPVDVAVAEKGFRGSIRSGGNISLNFGNFANEGTVLAAGDLSINTWGAFSNVGESSYTVDTSITRRGDSEAPLIVPVLDANGNVLERRWLDNITLLAGLGKIPKTITYFTQEVNSQQSPATVAAGGRLSINAGEVRNANAQLLAQGDVAISSGAGVHNASGTIESRNGDISVAAASLTNTRGDTAWVVAWQEMFQGVDSGHNEEDFFEVIKQAEIAPAGVINAARDLSVATGTLDNRGALINAGRELSINAGASVNNDARQRAVKYVHSHVSSDGRVWDWASGRTKSQFGTHATGTPENTASTIQAGSALNITAGGILVNSGNVLGESVALSGSAITNGLTDYHTQTPAPTTPNRVISLASVDLGVSISNAQSALTAANATRATNVVTNAPALTSGGLSTIPPGNTPAAATSNTDAARTLVEQAPQAPAPLHYGAPPSANSVGASLEANASAGATLRYLNVNPATSVLSALGADYLLSLLPQHLVTSNDLLFFADPYVEQQLLRQAALKEVGRGYFVNGLAFDDRNEVSIDTQQQAILYANAAEFAAANNVSLGQAFTEAQQNALDRPLLWYVEQKVKQRDGGEVTALVPTVYLPQLYAEHTQNLAGGLIQGNQVWLSTPGTLRNTGYIIGNDVAINAGEFANEKRLADIGTRTYRPNDEGYFKITGEAVQAGGFVSAANLELNAQRVASISGEFQLLAETQEQSQQRTQALLTNLRSELGASFSEASVQDDLHQEWVQTKEHDDEQLAMAVVSVTVAVMSGGAGAYMLGLQSGTLGATIANAAFSSMASSVVSGAISGDLSLESVLKAGITSAVTAGVLGNTGVSAWGLDKAGNVADWGMRAAGWAADAAIRSGLATAINGGSFQNAFVTNLVTAASADAAKLIGDTFNISANEATLGTSAAHAVSHAALGCASAAAQGKDCSAGAIGAAASAIASNFLSVDYEIDSITRQARATTASTLINTVGVMLAGAAIANAAGADVFTAMDAARNEIQNNRQLHPREIEWIRANAKLFAQQLCQQSPAACITVAEAEKRLAQQAAKDVDLLWRGTLANTNDEAAHAFLSTANATFVNDAGAQQKYFTAAGGDLFRPEVLATDAQLSLDFYRKNLHPAVVRTPVSGVTQEMKELGGEVWQTVKDNPWAAAKGAAGGVIESGKQLLSHPIDTVDGWFRGTGTAIGESANTVFNSESNRQLDALYGQDVTSVQATLLVGRAAAAAVAATGAGKVGGTAAGGIAAAGRKTLDKYENDAVEKAAIERTKIANNFYADGSPIDFPRELHTSSGLVVRANPDKTTTILGSFRADTERIMQSLDYQQSTVIRGATAPGSFNVLNVPDQIAAKLGSERFWNEVNKPFLDAAIARGDDIALATRPDDRYIFRADGGLTFFGREVQYLESRGFLYNSTTGRMQRVGGAR